MSSVMSGLELISGVFIGIVLWSCLEYALHHWLGHLGRGKNHFSREHLLHHAQVHYFAPDWQKGLIALVVSAVLTPCFTAFRGLWTGLGLAAGFVGMYLIYEILHRRAHTHPPKNRYGAWLRKHHFAHHFSYPKQNHGVTSSVWDHLFGTFRAVDHVRVPRRHAMQWLVCPRTGAVLQEFAQDYVLVGRRSIRAGETGPSSSRSEGCGRGYGTGARF